MRMIALMFSITLFFFVGKASEKQRTIHVFVALCDNVNQGIVPVSKLLGNGQDPRNNLYWGAAYGVKNFFDTKSPNWGKIKSIKNPVPGILERIVFKNTDFETFLIADAYRGDKIKQTTINFLHATAGQFIDTLKLEGKTLPIGGNADLIVYIGHNGLMDFDLDERFKVNRQKSRDVIILACYSRNYFHAYLEKFNTNPLVWSKGLMSPEAYTLKWAIDGWLANESNGQIVDRARKAYMHYQKCGIRGATNLLTTGFAK